MRLAGRGIDCDAIEGGETFLLLRWQWVASRMRGEEDLVRGLAKLCDLFLQCLQQRVTLQQTNSALIPSFFDATNDLQNHRVRDFVQVDLALICQVKK